MSTYSVIMERVFQTLDDPTTKHLIGETDAWTPEAKEVLAALDAFADEQVETVSDAVRREYGEGPEEGWLISNHGFTDLS